MPTSVPIFVQILELESIVKDAKGTTDIRALSIKGGFTRYDFVACNLLTTRLRQFSGHDCRKVLEHVLKSYDILSWRFRISKNILQQMCPNKITSVILTT